MKMIALFLLLYPAGLRAASYDALFDDAVRVKEQNIFWEHLRNYGRLYTLYGQVTGLEEQKKIAREYILPITSEMRRLTSEMLPLLQSPEMKESFQKAADASRLADEAWAEAATMLDTHELRRLPAIQEKLDESGRLIDRYKSSYRLLIRGLKREMKFAKEPRVRFKKI